MVTVSGDNRYYRRYFKRQQYQSLPAEEYEVREMFERSGRLRSETEQYLASRNYLDVTASNFADNSLSKRLYMHETSDQGSALIPAQSSVAFLALPDTLLGDAIDTIGDELWRWLQPELRLYPPAGLLLPIGAKRPVFDGVLLFEDCRARDRSFWDRYLFVARNGFAEMGLSRAQQYQGQMHFPLVEIVGRFWQFLGLVTDLYRGQGLLRPFSVMLNMKGTAGSTLDTLGDGWSESTEYRMLGEPPPNCLDPNLQFVLNMRDPDVSPDHIERCVRQIAAQIDAAYGSRDLRCFNDPKKDPTQAFPRRKMW